MKFFIFIFIIFFISACSQVQPESENSSPVTDTHKNTQKTVEDNKDNAEQVVNEQDNIIQEVEQSDQEYSRTDVEATNDVVKLEKEEEELESEDKYYQVIKVVDGDTITVDIDGKTERIRIIGLNTPETVDPRKPVECFGQEASNKARELLSGQEVRLEAEIIQGDRDKYGRLLRYVYLKNGTDFALKMIKDGYGYEYTYDLPYNNQKQYNEAEAYARENELGLWAPGICVEEEEEEAEIIPVAPVPSKPENAQTPGTANFKITYIFYDGEEGRSEPDEYVEIKNTGGTANLKGYALLDDSKKTYIFKDLSLAAGESIKIFTGCGDDTSSSLYWCFTSSAIWNNSGDTATLKDPSGKVVDSYSYKK